MLSRVADSVFWMSRYIERTDNILRALRTNYIASQDELRNFDWQLWLAGLGVPMEGKEGSVSYRQALYHLLLNKENDTSLMTNIARARENARSVQDYLTKEVWQCMNSYYHLIRDPQTEHLLLKSDPVTAFDNLQRESTLFYGTVDITLNRGEGYSFLNVGKYIERSLQSLDILYLKLKELQKGGTELTQWKYLLYALSGYEFHIKHYRQLLTTENVMHQVLLNVQFPHSVLYSLTQVDRYFKRLEPLSIPEHFKEIEFLTGKAVSNLRYRTYQPSNMDEVIQVIEASRADINDLSRKITSNYFGYS